MHKMGRISLKIILSILAFVVCLVVILQLGLMGGTAWLNTGKGQVWAKSRIDGALAGTNYHLDYKSIGYRLNGLALHDAILRDDVGPIASLDRASFGFSATALSLGELAMSLNAGHVTVYKIPKADVPEEKTAEPIQPFVLPNIFIKTITLNEFSINKLELKPEVIGQN